MSLYTFSPRHSQYIFPRANFGNSVNESILLEYWLIYSFQPFGIIFNDFPLDLIGMFLNVTLFSHIISFWYSKNFLYFILMELICFGWSQFRWCIFCLIMLYCKEYSILLSCYGMVSTCSIYHNIFDNVSKSVKILFRMPVEKATIPVLFFISILFRRPVFFLW